MRAVFISAAHRELPGDAGGDALDEGELANLFDAMDTDGNGVISKQEFKARATRDPNLRT